MMDDPDYYEYALGVSYAIPSAETLRQRFAMIGDSLRKDILQADVNMLCEMMLSAYLPNFCHMETGRSLDGKM